MITPALKFKYELHYVSTDITGSNEQAVESIHIKPIYFSSKLSGKTGDWGYKVAFGLEWIVDI